jgi:N-acetylglucosaminyldiphosphoundecaprenol N-acetyl-beta-D-mannosaminyltransferase
MGISIKKILKSFSLGGYDDTVKICIRRIQNGKQTSIFTPNSEMVSRAARSEDLLKILNSADILFPDGIGIHMGMKLLSIPVSERTTGIDLAERLIREAAKGNHKIFLLGAKDGVSSRAASNINEKYSSHIICGYHHGYFDKDDEIIKDIAERSPDLLAVCLGSPRQEIWVSQSKEKISGVGAILCLGGALDVWSGNIKRAPAMFINLRLEWLWRMLCEPKRMRELPKMVRFRYLTRKSR